MRKYIRKHLKDEKRILKLMYRKGIFELLKININSVSWEYLLRGRKGRRGKGRSKYGIRQYIPELHTFWTDYWGEGDSCSVIENFKNHLHWEGCGEVDEVGFPTSKYPTKEYLFKYLKSLPTIKNDSKFNIVLRRGEE